MFQNRPTNESMQEEKKPFPNYLRNLGYNSDTKTMRSYGLAKEANAKQIINEIREIKPSQLTQSEVRGFIRFYDDKYTVEQYQQSEQGKWILRFPSGSENIDKAWQLLVDCVAKGELDEIKVYPQSNLGEFAGQQSILIYNLNVTDKKAVVAVYDKLKKLGLVDLHLQERINQGRIEYKSDQQTKNNEYGKNVYLYTNHDMDLLRKEIEADNLRIVMAIDEKLASMVSKWDQSLPINFNFKSQNILMNIDTNDKLTSEQKIALKVIVLLGSAKRELLESSETTSMSGIVAKCKEQIEQEINKIGNNARRSIWASLNTNRLEILGFLDQLISEIKQTERLQNRNGV